jgi:serine protease Do
MIRKYRYGPAIVLLLTTLAVMILGPHAARRIAWAQSDARITLAKNTLAHTPSLAELSDSFRRVAQVVEPSVVHIQISTKARGPSRRGPMEEELLRRFFGPHGFWWQFPEDEQGDQGFEDGQDMGRYNVPQVIGAGSGWVYDDQGHIITNNHVIENADIITVRFQDGTEREATVVGVDPKTDIAVIEINPTSGLHPATLAEASVEQGDIVFAFGSPFQFEFSMSQGIVSAKNRRLGILDRRKGYENFIQTDAAINPGNSGGPLTNIYGQVVGMNTAIASRTGTNNGLGFAIPIGMVKNVVEQLIKSGRVQRGYLGVYIQDLNPKLAQTFGYQGEGVLVGSMIEGTPAEKAGLRRGDIITKINGQTVTSADELRNLVADYAPGTELTVEYFRDGKTSDVMVVIGELPDSVASAGETGPTGPSSDSASEDTRQLLRKLGFESLITLSEPLAEQLEMQYTPGVLVRSVRPGSAAQAAGISPRNIITEVMGKPVDSVERFVDELGRHDLSKGVRLSILDDDMLRYALIELPE